MLAVGVAIVVIASGGGDGDDDKKRPAAAPLPPAADPFTKNLPFIEPQRVRSRSGLPKVLKADITAANGTLEVSGVEVAGGQAYTARTASDVASPPGMLGPTLHAEPGGTIDLTFDNGLTVPEDMQGPADCVEGVDHAHRNSPADAKKPQVTNFHFHGLRVTPETRKIDGVTVYGDNVLVDLKPETTSRIKFPIPPDHERGTFWYHAHRHGCTDDQVSRGLAGLLFIGDSREELPARFRNVETRDLMLQDLQVAKTPDGWQVDPGHDWSHPTNRMVNGRRQPRMEIRPGETQLWRIANGSAGVWFDVALVDDSGTPVGFTTVAQDGNTLVDSQEEPSHLLGPGNRVDVLVTGPESGELALKTLAFSQGAADFPEELLATVTAKGAPAEPIEAPGQLAPPPKFKPTKGPDREYTFSFLLEPSFRALINGQAFSLDAPPQATPTLNTTETWTLKNATPEFHPIHIHQGDFVVRSVNGKPVDNHGQQDVVPLPPMQGSEPGEVVFEMSFEEEGDFVFHCHILDHEDAGMMAKVSVTKGGSR